MTDETHVQIYRSRPRAEASLHVLADAFSALAELRMMGYKSSELPGAVSISYHEDMLLLSSKGNAHATNKTEACLTMNFRCPNKQAGGRSK